MKPRVYINMAMSLDGKVSSKQREPTNFTSSEDKRRLLEIRSTCDALIVAARTADIDYQTMGISSAKHRRQRLHRGQTEHPVRVVVSGRLSLNPQLRIFSAPISPIVIVCTASAPRKRQNYFATKGHLLICGKREVDVCLLIRFLVKKYGVKNILCEGGPTLNDAFFRAGVVDELFLTICPKIVGGKSAPTLVEGRGFNRLSQAKSLSLHTVQKGKTEYFLHFKK